jgi:hypothetical protein
MMEAQNAMGLIVIEADSSWDITSSVPSSRSSKSLVISQRAEESATELSERVVGQIEAFARRGRTIGKAVLATGQSLAEEVVAARYAIVRALLTSGVMAPGARVVLAADERMPAAARHGLLGLAGAVMSELSGLPFQLDIRLGSVLDTDGAPTSAWQTVPSA